MKNRVAQAEHLNFARSSAFSYVPKVSDGRFGRVEHSTFNEGIPAEISCQILADAWRDNADGQWTQGSDVDPSTSLMAAAARMAQRRHEDITSEEEKVCL